MGQCENSIVNPPPFSKKYLSVYLLIPPCTFIVKIRLGGVRAQAGPKQKCAKLKPKPIKVQGKRKKTYQPDGVTKEPEVTRIRMDQTKVHKTQ